MQLDDHMTLKILAGLLHDFRRIFAPLLFSKIVVTHSRARQINVGQIDDPPWLQYVKEFEFQTSQTAEYKKDVFGRPLIAMKALQNMPNLTTFQ